ncbi:MAG TPA: glycoside hydrolase family 3 N-terminal domain-containing protein [Caproicibacter sp.]|nr:glycoside hydrolase family 3 N-terminal domain-containing protein [Caproicibacter sp.]
MKYNNKELSPKERALDLLSRMTVREKVGQLNQKLYGFSCYKRSGQDITLSKEFQSEVEKWCGLGLLYGFYRADPWSGRTDENGITNEMVPLAYNTVQKYVISHSRFGIPVLMSSECPHGHQALNGYLLPTALAMGASFQPALVKSAFSVCAKQLRTMGVDLALVSVLDVLRDPRWGRSEESFGEDPFLCSQMAQAAVRAFQDEGVTMVAKHFCAQGEGTGGVNASAARIGERELREIHLPPTAACCRAGVGGIMAAYNEIDGLPCHANPHLLKDILRDEMHFSGIVMADGTAVDRLNILTGSSEASGALALKSGVDVSLWDDGFSQLETALEKGLVSMEELNASVLRVLELKFSRGLFEKPYLEEKIDLDCFQYNHYGESLELARSSPVLLKNSNRILPLDRSRIHSIAVIGPNADDVYRQSGDYTPPIKDGITVKQGIRSEAGKSILVRCAQGCGEEAVAAASQSDVTVLVLGGSSSRFEGAEFDVNGAAAHAERLPMDCGEGVDSASLSLNAEQFALAKAVFDLNKPVVTILIAGRPYAIPEIAERTDALIYAFYPGPMGGSALAEILFGKTSPSGRLPVSIPRSAGQLPVYYNYKNSYDAMQYHDEKNTPLYPFGFGLSYTDYLFDGFRISDSSISMDKLKKDGITVNFEIRNEGQYDGFAVPMLYLHDVQASTVRRVRELKAFQKIFVKAGESQGASLRLSCEDFAIWDSQMEFRVEPGEFQLELRESDTVVWKVSLMVL